MRAWRIPTVVLFCTLLVPLVSYAGLFFPFVTTKAFLFFVLIEIAALYAVFDVARERISIAYSPFTALLAVFVCVVALADAFGVYPGLSVFSTFERTEGLLMLVHALLFFVLLRTYFDERAWRFFWIMLCAVGIVAGLYGLVQWFGGVARPGSTFGNPIYFAGFELFCIFLAFFKYARSRFVYERYIYVGAGIVGLLAIYISGTRGAFIGLVLGTTAAFALFAWRRFGMRVFFGAFVISVPLLSVLWVTLAHLQTAPASLERFTSLSLSDPTVFSRLVLAQIAMQGIQERPLLGFGQEGFIDVYARHYDERLFGYEPWHDRAHNVFLDWFVASGIIGGILFIACVAVLFFFVSRHFEYNPWLFGLLVAYSTHLATVFLDTTAYVVLFALAAFLDKNTKAMTPVPEREQVWVAVSIMTASILLVSALHAPAWVTARSVLDALFHTEYLLFFSHQHAPHATQASMSARHAFARAEAWGSRVREVHEQRAVAAIRIAPALLSEEERRAWYQESVLGLMYNHMYFKYDPRQLVLLGDVHVAFGALTEAQRAYEQALVLSPKKQSIMLALAHTYYRAGAFEKARILLNDIAAVRGPMFPSEKVRALEQALTEVE